MSTRTKFCRITGPDMSSNALEYRLRVSSRAQRGICFSPPLITSPANSPCQTVVPLVHCLLYTSAAASVASCGHHSTLKKCSKIAQFLCNLSPLDPTLLSSLVCVANKDLARHLSLLDATLTNNPAVGRPSVCPPCTRLLVTEQCSLRSRNALLHRNPQPPGPNR